MRNPPEPCQERPGQRDNGGLCRRRVLFSWKKLPDEVLFMELSFHSNAATPPPDVLPPSPTPLALPRPHGASRGYRRPTPPPKNQRPNHRGICDCPEEGEG